MVTKYLVEERTRLVDLPCELSEYRETMRSHGHTVLIEGSDVLILTVLFHEQDINRYQMLGREVYYANDN
jgi:hypothetical protein